MKPDPRPQIWVIRHAETEWSLNGRHTGKTDSPLTARGNQAAVELKPWISAMQFATVLSSPRTRAIHTAQLCGLEKQVQIDPLLAEWDYGDYEGWTSLEIAMFTHGHFSRVLIATWLELPVTRGRSFSIRAGSVNVLGWEHINKVIWSMGAVPSGPGVGR